MKKISRNSQCYCNSGKKYKKCCLISSQSIRMMCEECGYYRGIKCEICTDIKNYHLLYVTNSISLSELALIVDKKYGKERDNILRLINNKMVSLPNFCQKCHKLIYNNDAFYKNKQDIFVCKNCIKND